MNEVVRDILQLPQYVVLHVHATISPSVRQSCPSDVNLKEVVGENIRREGGGAYHRGGVSVACRLSNDYFYGRQSSEMKSMLDMLSWYALTHHHGANGSRTISGKVTVASICLAVAHSIVARRDHTLSPTTTRPSGNFVVWKLVKEYSVSNVAALLRIELGVAATQESIA